MQVNSISINRRYQGKGYECRVTIDAEFSQVVLQLDEDHTQRVIDCVADLIVEGGKRVAEGLTKQALDHKAIEYKSAEAAG